MSPAPTLSPSVETSARRYRVAVSAGLLSRFTLKRAAFYLLVPLPALALCLHFGQGVLGLALLVVGFWPFPSRCSVEHDGLRVAWLFVEEWARWDEIAAIELGEDRRRGVVGTRGLVLAVERRDKAPLVLRGRAEVLERLAGDLTEHALPPLKI